MNLLYSITAYLPSTGGAQIHLGMLAQRLASENSIEICTFWDNNRTDWLLGTTLRAPSSLDYLESGIPVHRLGFSTFQKYAMAPGVIGYYPLMNIAVPWIASFLLPQIQRHATRADIIHHVRIGREPLAYASWQAARKRKIPFVFTPLHHPRWQGWRYRVYHHLYGQADALVTLTRSEKDYLAASGVKEERIHVLGHGPVLSSSTNPDDFLKKYNLSAPIILFLGQHYPYKGFRELIETAPLVWRKFPEAHFVFIGPPIGSSESIFLNNQDPRILRLGTVDLQTKTDALAACSILCVPSTQESFGGVYTEAWSFEKPVIGCPIPAVSEIIAEGEDGFLVEQNPRSIAERLLFLLEHPEEANRLGRNGKRKVSQHFTWEILATRMQNIYQALLH